MINFVRPGLLGDAKAFKRQFADPIESGQVKQPLTSERSRHVHARSKQPFKLLLLLLTQACVFDSDSTPGTFGLCLTPES